MSRLFLSSYPSMTACQMEVLLERSLNVEMLQKHLVCFAVLYAYIALVLLSNANFCRNVLVNDVGKGARQSLHGSTSTNPVL